MDSLSENVVNVVLETYNIQIVKWGSPKVEMRWNIAMKAHEETTIDYFVTG